MIVDSHCHISYPEFSEEIDKVIARAYAAGVGVMLNISTKFDEFEQILAVAKHNERIYCTVGVHPHEASEEPDVTKEMIVEKAKHPKVVGVGETGLDYYYEHSDRKVQRQLFIEHIKACNETGLPLIVHTRSAENDTLSVLKETATPDTKVIIHCFSGTKSFAKKLLDAGYYISMSGIVTFKNAVELKEVAAMIPDDRLLVETDSPYLAPVPNRGKRNEPSFIVHTVRVISELRKQSFETVAQATTNNFFKLFGKAEMPEKLYGCY